MHDRLIAIRKSKDLPHWTTPDGIYFITYRLADSLPQSLSLPRNEQQEWRRFDRVLDRGFGSSVLARPDAAVIIAENLGYFDGQRYSLLAWCVMPNHVHVVAKIFGSEVASVVHSWKSYTAKQINRMIGTRGVLWQRDYFDYLVRDVNELWRICEYVAANPDTAGLRDWEFVWKAPDVVAWKEE